MRLRPSAIAPAARAVARPAAMAVAAWTAREPPVAAAAAPAVSRPDAALASRARSPAALRFPAAPRRSVLERPATPRAAGRRRRCRRRRGRGVGRRRSGPCIAASLFAVVRRCDRDRWLRRTATSPRRAAQPCTGAARPGRLALPHGTPRAPAAWLPPRARTRAPRSCGFALRRRRGCARERFPAP